MTLKLTEEKKQKNYDLCTKLLEKSKPTIQFVAQIIGNIVASFPAVPWTIILYSVRNRRDCGPEKAHAEL